MDNLSGPDLCHCFALRRGTRHLSRLYDRHLASARVTITQFTILSILSRNPGIEVADLAGIMVMDRTALLRALKPLRQAGWVTSESANRGRRHAVNLTSEGTGKLSDARPLWEAAQSEYEDTFGLDRAARLREDVRDVVARGSSTTS